MPRACDAVSLAPLLRGPASETWRDAPHYEYDFRDVHYSQPEAALDLGMDESSLCVVQDARWKYVHFAALPPLLFDLHADRTLTHFRSTPAGLEQRDPNRR